MRKAALVICGVVALWAVVLPLLPSNLVRAEVVCSATVPSCTSVVSGLTVATGGVLGLSDGSAAAPSLVFASDPTIGWFRTSGTWAWAASAAERFRMESVSGGARLRIGNSSGQTGGYWLGSSPASSDVHFGRISGSAAAYYSGAATKTLTEAAATSFVQVSVASGADVGGELSYTVFASDATPNRQSLSGLLRFAAVNPAGTETCPAPTDIGTALTAANTGTLSCTWACDTTPTNAVNLQANCTSSLTQTALAIRYGQIMCHPSAGGDCLLTAQ